jgi:hypothetical protein
MTNHKGTEIGIFTGVNFKQGFLGQDQHSSFQHTRVSFPSIKRRDIVLLITVAQPQLFVIYCDKFNLLLPEEFLLRLKYFLNDRARDKID